MSNLARAALVAFISSAAVAAALRAAGRPAAADPVPFDAISFDNPTGLARTVAVGGRLSADNAFFEDLGSNGRRCVTCHQPGDGWSITPGHVQARFDASHGTDPIFANNDGSNCEGKVATSLAERRAAYSMLLTRGLIRVGLDLPQDAEFVIDRVSDPFRCAPGSTDTSLYRRPLPSTNLRFLSAVMWDGRESSSTTNVLQDLAQQAVDATLGHAQAIAKPTPDQVKEIVDFETRLFTAQSFDSRAGTLDARGAAGGPAALARERFFIGINDPVGFDPTGRGFDPEVFTLFGAWLTLRGDEPRAEARRAVARGQAIFNTKPITISGVAGLNEQTFSTGVTLPASFVGSCTVCHDTPNAGNHSVKAPLNIGVADPVRAPYLPVYTLRNLATHDVVHTTDPGRAMITGKWADVGKFKGPVLRGLAARAPYFHNGMSGTLEEVVDFYDDRFHIGLSAAEKADLVAFLRSL
jgi:cytochrome c peroxidase